ncbi:GNAT family N-acetyltransferase [Dyadobacter sp. MSC1_007]|jgi:GNAT superfamily N-acetyltransferase|uniref:GNAT family N-acetyltransferase n=1 Tax=Dyadobacter sp. MSC1_007 TaxID=2909264 RepID=UPI00203081D5|nr:GNAT family N-acetyltransferase [Dyadobacter sp. MSC1_007]
MEKETYQFKPVDDKTWPDLVKLFEHKGGPSYCWCMAWRELDNNDRSDNKAKKNALKSQVDGKIPIGLVGYFDDEPVAWCSVGPRESFRDLGGDDKLENVWSITCFFIRRDKRKLRLTEQLIKEATIYAKKHGAKHMEAYPVDPDSPSYRFMGFKPLFEKMGFNYRHKAGSRRHVMVFHL